MTDKSSLPVVLDSDADSHLQDCVDFHEILSSSRDVSAELVHYRLHDDGYLLGIVDGKLIVVVKFRPDQMMGLEIPFFNRGKEMKGLVEQVTDYGEQMEEIQDDSDLKDVGQFIRKVVLTVKEMINEAFDGPIQNISRARNLLLEPLKKQQEKKLTWLSPVQLIEKSLRKAMSEYVLKRELGKEDTGNEVVLEIEEDELLDRLKQAKEDDDAVAMEELMEIGRAQDEERGITKLVPYRKTKLDLGTGVSIRNLMPRYKVVKKEEIRMKYLIPDDARIKKEIRQHGFGAVGIVGGIKIYDKKSVTIRGK